MAQMTYQESKQWLSKTSFDIQNANGALHVTDLFYSAYANSKKLHGIEYAPIGVFLQQKNLPNFYQFLRHEAMDQAGAMMLSSYRADRGALKRWIRAHRSQTKALDAQWREYQRLRKKGMTTPQLRSRYARFIRTATRWWEYAVLGEDKGESSVEKLIMPAFVQRHALSIKEARTLLNVLAQPPVLTVFNQERLLFLEICLEVSRQRYRDADMLRKLPGVQRLLTRYRRRFFWIKTDFYRAVPLTSSSIIAEVVQELGSRSAAEVRQERNALRRQLTLAQMQRQRARRKLKLTVQDHEDIAYARQTIEWVDVRKAGMMHCFYYYLMIIADVVQHTGVPYDQLAYYAQADITTLLKTGKRLPAATVQKRQAGVFMIFNARHDPQYFFGAQGQELLRTALHTNDTVLQGIVASRGKEITCEGTVRIVSDPLHDIFNDGEILITSMTRVEYVPLMRRAKAIITDEGGMACHAAIVSRELGVPAVIGTKRATRELKSGDRVEVDMEKGVVKKIIH